MVLMPWMVLRGDLELMGYLGDGAQDLVLDFSMRHYRGGAAGLGFRV